MVYRCYTKATWQILAHSENVFLPLTKQDLGGVTGACECGWAQNGQLKELEEPEQMQVLKHDDAMHMMT